MELRAAAPHIVISHVTKRYTTAQRGGLLALRDVSLEAGKGEFISIVGPSGCGKSTLLYIVAGLLDATSGAVTVDSKAIDGPSPDRGVVLQNFSIFPWRRVVDNVVYGPEMRGVLKPERRRLARKYLELVGLDDFADYYPRELSGGMKQRVAIAQMLACNPSIFLMDEPFGTLDALTREALQDQLLQLWERDRKTVLFVTHSIDEAVLLSDRVAIMGTKPGRIKQIVPTNLPRPRQPAEIRAAAIGAYCGRRPNRNLILRRPHSGRLEGWAAQEIAAKAVSQHPICGRPFETPRSARLLRVRFRCNVTPTGGLCIHG